MKNADLAVAILRAQEVTNELEEQTSDTEGQLELYDKVLEAYAEAEKVAKKAVKDDEVCVGRLISSLGSLLCFFLINIFLTNFVCFT